MTESLLYTLPQWFVFAAIFGVVYGWVEDKKAFRLIGLASFILLGGFSLFVFLGDFLAVGNYLTPEEVASEELNEEVLNEVPIQARLFSAYLSFIGAAVLAIPSLVLDWFNKKHAKLFIVLTGFVALLGFFIVVGAIRSV